MEAVLMEDFDHRNVMWLIAIMIDNDMKPHVLLPLMEHGDLRSFISKPNNVCIILFMWQRETSLCEFAETTSDDKAHAYAAYVYQLYLRITL